MPLKFGRRPARHTLRTARSMRVMFNQLAALGSPPVASDDYVTPLQKALSAGFTGPISGFAPDGTPFGVFLNDSLGDCVCADSAHQVMIHTANAGTLVLPSNDDVLKLYEAVGGYVPGNESTDTGCDETSMCQYLQATGLSGQKSAGSGMIDPTQLDHLKWAVQLFGACRLGIVVCDAMLSQFGAHEPWTTPADPNDTSAGGHDVPIVKYDTTYAYVITWGELQAVAWSLLAQSAFLEEAHAEVWPDFCAAAGNAPNGFNLQQLLADLPSVEQPS